MGNSLGNGITIQKKIQFFVSNILTLIKNKEIGISLKSPLPRGVQKHQLIFLKNKLIFIFLMKNNLGNGITKKEPTF